MSQNTTELRARRDVSKSRSTQSSVSGNKNVRAVRSPAAMGNRTLGVAERAVRENIKGPFLGTNRPS